MAGERVVYRLQYPIEFGSETITELSLRRVKGKDIRAVRNTASPASETLDLIGRLSGQPRPVIDELDAIDVEEVGKIVEGFTKSGPPTGDTPSQS